MLRLGWNESPKLLQVKVTKFLGHGRQNLKVLSVNFVINAEVKIAGHSTDFVNRVLERVKAGEPSGGLDEI
jgi:hypothetical protein